MSLTGVLLRHDSQAEFAIMKLEENCMGGGWAGWGPDHRSQSAKARCEGGAQGLAVRVVEAMWRSVAMRARLSKRQAMKRAVFES